MELSSSNTFSKDSCFYISGNGNPENICYIFLIKKLFLYLGKQKPRKKFLIFQEELPESQKSNILIFLQNKL